MEGVSDGIERNYGWIWLNCTECSEYGISFACRLFAILAVSFVIKLGVNKQLTSDSQVKRYQHTEQQILHMGNQWMPHALKDRVCGGANCSRVQGLGHSIDVLKRCECNPRDNANTWLMSLSCPQCCILLLFSLNSVNNNVRSTYAATYRQILFLCVLLTSWHPCM
jgi:hypothetical protein